MSRIGIGVDAEGNPSQIAQNAYEHPIVWEYVGRRRYLQVAVSKSITQLYTAKFGTVTSSALSKFAAEGNLVELLDWTREAGCVFDDSLYICAARGGSADVLHFLKFAGCPEPPGPDACIVASKFGSLGALKALRQYGFEWDAAVCRSSSEGGFLEVLQYAWENDCPRQSLDVSELAAKRSHIHILKWMHNIGEQFNSRICAGAASYGHLEILQYLRSVDTSWGESTCWAAIRGSHLHVLKWAIENKCPWTCTFPWTIKNTLTIGPHRNVTPVHYASRYSTIEILEYLLELGGDINAVDSSGRTPILFAIMGRCKPEAVKFMISAGADFNIATHDGESPLKYAIKYELVEIVVILKEAGAV